MCAVLKRIPNYLWRNLSLGCYGTSMDSLVTLWFVLQCPLYLMRYIHLWVSFFQPFTNGFPRADINELLLPDLLHQLIKGAFKDHLVTWVNDYIKAEYPTSEAQKILDSIDHRYVYFLTEIVIVIKTTSQYSTCSTFRQASTLSWRSTLQTMDRRRFKSTDEGM